MSSGSGVFGHTERVAAFLDAACPDAHVPGPFNHALYQNAAMRIVTRHPEVARDSLLTAVVCGDVEEVQRVLRTDPAAASAAGAPKAWPPLLYLCNARLPLPAVEQNANAIATALLDAGADPNASYVLRGSQDYKYTALTCLLGRGEEEARTHASAEGLTELLLERDAEPYDTQLLYNVFADNSSRPLLGDDIVWLLDAIYRHAIRRDRAADWTNPQWPMLDPWGRGDGAGFLLEGAVNGNHLKLAEWILAHGASPNATRMLDGRRTRSPYEQALRNSRSEMAGLLLRYGATATASGDRVNEAPEDAFVAACLRLDRDTVSAEVAAHPDYLRSTAAMFAAARADRADVVELLLDLGVSPDVEDAEHGHGRTLHQAAAADAVDTIAVLVARGAEVDARESNWNATPLGFAVFGQSKRAIEALSRVSCDVFNLTFTGRAGRLRDLFRTNPDLAKTVNANGGTLLMRLPDDEALALEIVDLLIANGADPSARTTHGVSAADEANRRGMERVAERLRVAAEPGSTKA